MANKDIQFFLPMIPPTVTAQEHKFSVRNADRTSAKLPQKPARTPATKGSKGKPVVYDPPELKEARAKLTAYLAKHKPEKPYTKGVHLEVKWCFPLKFKHRDGEYRTTRPDTDNLQKLLKDCMTAVGFWKDDALVASELCEKFWAQIPGIFIRIEVLE